jgi:hypothetical protein
LNGGAGRWQRRWRLSLQIHWTGVCRYDHVVPGAG